MDLIVEYEVLEKHIIVSKTFTSYRQCKNFVNKLRHSKVCRLVSYPNFKY